MTEKLDAESAVSYVAGSWVPVTAADASPRRSPIDGVTAIPAVVEATTGQIDEAVEAVRHRQRAWARTSPTERAAVLRAMGEALRDRREQLAEMMVLEVGKSPAEALGEIDVAVGQFDYFAASVWRDTGRTFPTPRPRTHVHMVREPFGVVAAITPWNFPVSLAVNKIAPALAVGNTVVLKPAPETAGVAMAMTATLVEAADGLLALVQGGGRVGETLVQHPGVDMVAFTGSTGAGVQVAAAAAQGSKGSVCEMGGKNAMVVMDDADVTTAVDAAVAGAYRMAGQKCTATSLLLVHSPVRSAVLDALRDRFGRLVVGDPRDPGVTVGPVIDATSRDRVEGLIEKVTADGGDVDRVPLGDRVPHEGHYVAPALVVDPPRASALRTEEIFGPVLAVEEVDDFDTAVARINGMRYGLVASIYTATYGARFVDEVACGTVVVNQPTTGLDSHIPFAGWKDSGIGGVEQSDLSLDTYSRHKVGYLSW